MIGVYLHPDIFKFIENMGADYINLDFIPLENIPMSDTVENTLSFEQNDDFLYNIGLTSGSSFVNQIQLIYYFIFLI